MHVHTKAHRKGRAEASITTLQSIAALKSKDDLAKEAMRLHREGTD